MREIVFEQKRPNHFYAKRNSKGQFELVEEPENGQRYYEAAVVAGG